jgi:hypothetical protein
MTLILTQASGRYVLQVSDRLLTQPRRRKPFDPASNKTILYLTTDALVSIAYSGGAYLDETPTDQWIAETLKGERHALDDQVNSEPGSLKQWPDIDQSIELIRAALESAVLPLENPPLVHIIVAGWKWTRDEAHPIVTHILNSAEDPPVFYIRPLQLPEPVEAGTGSPLILTAAPTDNPLLPDEFEQLFEDLRRTNPSPGDSLRVLVEAIRVAASRQPKVVSQDCMSVFLPPPSARVAEVTYISHLEQRAVIAGRQVEELPAAFSPWVIGPGKTIAPSILVGSLSTGLGPFTVTITAPPVPDDAGIRVIWSSQRRPPQPQRRRPDSQATST